MRDVCMRGYRFNHALTGRSGIGMPRSRGQNPVAAQLGYFICAGRRKGGGVCRDELRGYALDLRGFDSRWHKGSVSSKLSDDPREPGGMRCNAILDQGRLIS
jgi:hypothetical protein